MQAKKLISLLVISALYACSVSSENSVLSSETSYELEKAISLFDRRTENLDRIAEAKDFIKYKLDNTKPSWDEEARAYDMSVLLFRITYYEAKHYHPLPTQKDERQKIFMENVAYVDKYLSPEVLKWHHPGYYYYKFQSLLAYADDGTYLEQLQALTQMNNLLLNKDKAAGVDEYAGGGMWRLQALFRSREYWKGTPGGTYYPEGAYKLIDRAILSEAYPGDASGDLVCDNYLARAELEYQVTKNAIKPSVYSAQVVDLFKEFLDYELINPSDLPEAQDCMAKAKNFASDKGVVLREMTGNTVDHNFEYQAAAYFSSTAKWAGQVSLEAYCLADDLRFPPIKMAGSKYFKYEPSMTGKSFALNLSLPSESVPCVPKYLAFNSDNILISTSFVDLKFIDYGLTDEKYAADTKTMLDDTYSLRLANYSISMAQQALAQPNMFCNIQQAAKNPRVDAGFLQKVKADYYNVFGVLFDDPNHQFTCPPTETLKGEIGVCVASPDKSTPFCNSYRLYMQALGWIDTQLAETNRRLIKISNKQSQIYKDLQSLSDRLQEESDGSDTVLGEDDID